MAVQQYAPALSTVMEYSADESFVSRAIRQNSLQLMWSV